MTFKLSLITLSLVISSSAFSAVNISSPEEIVILAVNDQEVNAGILRTQKNDFKVDAGDTTISMRYQQYFEHNSGEHDILKSGVVTISAPNLEDGKSYKLALVNAPKNFDLAKKYADQPTIALYDQQNKLVVQQTGANNEAKPWLSSGLFGRAMDLTQKKNTHQPEAVYGKSASSTQTNKVMLNDSNMNGNKGISENQPLVQMWKNASKAERQQFMSWLAEQ